MGKDEDAEEEGGTVEVIPVKVWTYWENTSEVRSVTTCKSGIMPQPLKTALPTCHLLCVQQDHSSKKTENYLRGVPVTLLTVHEVSFLLQPVSFESLLERWLPFYFWYWTPLGRILRTETQTEECRTYSAHSLSALGRAHAKLISGSKS